MIFRSTIIGYLDNMLRIEEIDFFKKQKLATDMLSRKVIKRDEMREKRGGKKIK